MQKERNTRRKTCLESRSNKGDIIQLELTLCSAFESQ